MANGTPMFIALSNSKERQESIKIVNRIAALPPEMRQQIEDCVTRLEEEWKSEKEKPYL